MSSAAMQTSRTSCGGGDRLAPCSRAWDSSYRFKLCTPELLGQRGYAVTFAQISVRGLTLERALDYQPNERTMRLGFPVGLL